MECGGCDAALAFGRARSVGSTIPLRAKAVSSPFQGFATAVHMTALPARRDEGGAAMECGGWDAALAFARARSDGSTIPLPAKVPARRDRRPFRALPPQSKLRQAKVVGKSGRGRYGVRRLRCRTP